uniref:Cysteine protease n=1 Tax=Strigamia maritima TaxID=126957 RepID=T1J1K5_STRMM
MFGSLGNKRRVELENVSGQSYTPASVTDEMDSGFWNYTLGVANQGSRLYPRLPDTDPTPTFVLDAPRSSRSREDKASATTNLKSWFTREKEKKKNSQSNGATSDHSSDKMKTKFISMWNNMKYGLSVKLKTNFSRDSAIWLLGHSYHQKPELCADPSVAGDLGNVFREFQLDFCTRIWLTYRREFEELDGSSYTTDCGWGCMLRSGQMLLAEGLVRHLMGRDWRFKVNEYQSPGQNEMHRQIVRWFGDTPDEKSPFALHHLVAIGKSMGKKAGDWYGPASVAHIMRHALENSANKHSLLEGLHIYVAQDCTVYKGDVLKLCTGSSLGGDVWQGVVIFVPLRLGGESFNHVYAHCVRIFLSDPNCIGIIGGRPKHSLYFVGYQDDKLIHLDPHYCQEVVDVSAHDFPLQSFHCMSPRKMSFSRMDPSCTIGFYCGSRTDFDAFVKFRHSPTVEYPVFVVTEGTNETSNMDCMTREEMFICPDYRLESDVGSELDSEEEFVVL